MDKTSKDLYKKGKNALKKGIFKWSKDYVSAAMYFDQASKSLRIQKNYVEAIKVYLDLVPVNKKLNDNWAVAKNYENVINCLFLDKQENISTDEIFKYTELAIDQFAMENSQNTLYMSLENIAK